jgi:hypothetical protein
MPTTLAPPRPQSASVIAGYGIAIANALEYTGIDSRRVFRAAGVDEELRNDPMHRLSVETVSRLYAICVDVTGSFTFGLTVARFLQASHLHAVGYGALASSTLLDFGQRMTRFMHLVSQSATMEIRESGAETQLVCIVHVPVCPQTLDAWAAFLVRLMRIMHGGDLRPLRVELPHPAPPDGNCRPYLDMFRAPVLFDQRDVVLAFAQDVMRADLPGRMSRTGPIQRQGGHYLPGQAGPHQRRRVCTRGDHRTTAFRQMFTRERRRHALPESGNHAITPGQPTHQLPGAAGRHPRRMRARLPQPSVVIGDGNCLHDRLHRCKQLHAGVQALDWPVTQRVPAARCGVAVGAA